MQNTSNNGMQINRLIGALGDLTRLAFPNLEDNSHNDRLRTLCEHIRSTVGADLACVMHTTNPNTKEVHFELASGRMTDALQGRTSRIIPSDSNYLMPELVQQLGFHSSRVFAVSPDLERPSSWFGLFWFSSTTLAIDIEEFLKSAAQLVRTEIHMCDVNQSREWLSHKLAQEKRAHQRSKEELDRVLRVERLFRTIGNTIPFGVFVTDADGLPSYVSSSFLDLIGMSFEEYRRFKWKELLHPEQREMVETGWLDSVKNSRSWSCEFQISGRDGKMYTLMGRAAPFFDDNGHLLGYAGVHFDITDRRSAEDKLRESEVRYRQIVDVANEGIWKLDVFGETTFTNKSVTSIIGYSADQLASTHIWDYIEPECLDSFKEAWTSVLSFKQEQVDCAFRCKDDRKIWAYISLSPIADSDGQMSGILALVTDVTRRHEIEDKLKAATASAESANEAKSQFLANMSHEIRTPLTAVLGFGELLLDPELSSAERNESVQAIRRNGRMLLNLINDILDLSKVEAGKLSIEPLQFSVHELCEELTASFRPQADEKGIEFKVSRGEDVPDTICSDPTRVRQILLNLVGNAFKFTSSGKVELSCRMERNQLVVTVSDTGPGIHKKDVARLFEPFSQADASITRRFGGTGLGLILSRNLARSLSGDVSLRYTEPGKGSIFEVRFPVDLPCTTNVKAVEKDRHPFVDCESAREYFQGTSVLVVDDSSDNCLLVTRLLNPYGIKVESAHNGRVGCEKALTGKFDIVFMDIQMPEMDGYEATKILRGEHYTKPIVALTAHAMKEERDHSFEVGCTAHLTKPLNKHELLDVIWKYVLQA